MNEIRVSKRRQECEMKIESELHLVVKVTQLGAAVYCVS